MHRLLASRCSRNIYRSEQLCGMQMPSAMSALKDFKHEIQDHALGMQHPHKGGEAPGGHNASNTVNGKQRRFMTDESLAQTTMLGAYRPEES
jgi:hypothetical protein